MKGKLDIVDFSTNKTDHILHGLIDNYILSIFFQCDVIMNEFS